MRKLIFVVLAVGVQLMAADPRLGTWKLVAARSTQDPPRKAVANADGDGFHTVSSNGMEFSAKYDGQPYALLGIPIFDYAAFHRTSKDSIMVFYMKDGKVIETDRLDYSIDGNEMVETNSFILPSRPDVIWVFDRTGGARVPADPHIGEWTRNLSKSRLRQGLVLRIESNGDDGVLLVGDVTYSARPDGMDYPVKDSRLFGTQGATSVALQFLDPRTVASVYKRDGKVCARDRWVVSEDGTRMTMTVDGTQASGVRIHEELEFARQ